LSFNNRSAQQGFTLIEVLLAVFITALMISALYGVFSSISASKNRLDSDSELYHGARVLFDRLGKELRSLHYDSRQSRTLLRGGERSGEIYLEFSSTLATPHANLPGSIRIISYESRKDRRDEEERQELLRVEAPLLEDPQQSRALRMMNNIRDLRLRFYEKSRDSWENDWDSSQSRSIPDLIEITLVLESEGRTAAFRSAFDLKNR